MNLTPEQRATGVENFQTVIGDTRRDFLKKGIMAGLVSGGGLGAFYFGYEATVPNPVRVGVLGTGDEGSVLIGAINPKFIEVKSIADIRPYNVYRAFHGDSFGEVAMKARPGLMAKYGWKSEDEARKHVKVYDHTNGGYEELIKNAKQDGIEAVIIALPLHLHKPAAVAAMQAGLHVLTEKLMAQNIKQCKEMARTAEDTNTVLAVGHQRHYNILYENAVDTIRRGLLGDLHFVRAQWHRGNLPGSDSWQMPMPEKLKPADKLSKKLADELKKWEKELADAKKSGTSTDLLVKMIAQRKAQIADEALAGLVAKYGYAARQYKDATGKVIYDCPPEEELIRWRLFDRTGGGMMAELGSHQLDAASIFVAAMHGGKKQHPLNVVAAANRPVFPVDRDIEDHVFCVIEFPAPGYDPKDKAGRMKKIGVQYSSINGNGFGGYGEIVFGTKGTMILEKEQEVMIFKESDTSSKVTVGKSKGGAAVLDTQASGDPGAAAVGKMATQDVSRGYTEEEEHWAWCIRNRAPENQPRCSAKIAMGDAIIALTTNLAARHGLRVEFKEEWFDPKDDATPEEDLKKYITG